MVGIVEVNSKERGIVIVGREKCNHCFGGDGIHVWTVFERWKFHMVKQVVYSVPAEERY